MERDLTVLKEVLNLIDVEYEKNPDSFGMDSWAKKTSCGTSRCLAGWAVFSKGWMGYKKVIPWVDVKDDGSEVTVSHRAYIKRPGLQRLKEIDPDFYDWNVKGLDGEDVDWDGAFERLGADILSLDEGEASMIFYATSIQTPEELKERITRELGLDDEAL